jgi:hypothetical protein
MIQPSVKDALLKELTPSSESDRRRVLEYAESTIGPAPSR